MIFMKNLLALLVFLFCANVALADISLSGEGSVSTSPDVAIINVGVVTKAESAVQSLADNREAMIRLFEKVADLGIDKKCVQTMNFSIQSEYDHRTSRFVGYVTRNLITLTIHDVDKIGSILDSLVASGSNQVQNIRFGVINNKTLLADARRQAVADAKEKAKLYADAANIKLGKIISITEHISEQRVGYSAESTPIAGGELTYKVRVQISWEIEP